MFSILLLYQIGDSLIYYFSLWLVFLFFCLCLSYSKSFNLDEVQFIIYFPWLDCAFPVISKKSLLNSSHKHFLICFLLKVLWALSLELIFMYGVRYGLEVFVFVCIVLWGDIQLFQHSLLQKDYTFSTELPLQPCWKAAVYVWVYFWTLVLLIYFSISVTIPNNLCYCSF